MSKINWETISDTLDASNKIVGSLQRAKQAKKHLNYQRKLAQYQRTSKERRKGKIVEAEVSSDAKIQSLKAEINRTKLLAGSKKRKSKIPWLQVGLAIGGVSIAGIGIVVASAK